MSEKVSTTPKKLNCTIVGGSLLPNEIRDCHAGKKFLCMTFPCNPIVVGILALSLGDKFGTYLTSTKPAGRSTDSLLTGTDRTFIMQKKDTDPGTEKKQSNRGFIFAAQDHNLYVGYAPGQIDGEEALRLLCSIVHKITEFFAERGKQPLTLDELPKEQDTCNMALTEQKGTRTAIRGTLSPSAEPTAFRTKGSTNDQYREQLLAWVSSAAERIHVYIQSNIKMINITEKTIARVQQRKIREKKK